MDKFGIAPGHHGIEATVPSLGLRAHASYSASHRGGAMESARSHAIVHACEELRRQHDDAGPRTLRSA